MDSFAQARQLLHLKHDTVSRVGETFVTDTLDVKLREAELLIHKQSAYGPHNIGRPPHGIAPEVALVVRLNDKLQRLSTLLAASDGQPRGSESRLDSWLDVSGYGTIGTLLETGRWPGVGN